MKQNNAVAGTPHVYHSDEDLTETQMYVTIQTYDRVAKEYAERWEWNPITVSEIQKYNITPFTRYAKKKGTVLIVECQSGRDYSILSKAGYQCVGTGSSFGLLTEALARVPNGLFIHLNPRALPFMPDSFDALYADALTSVPRHDIRNVLTDFRIFLRSSGILYLSLKLGEKNIVELRDFNGKRYFTLYRKEEILSNIVNAGFTLLWSSVSPHTDPSLPNWFSLVARKS